MKHFILIALMFFLATIQVAFGKPTKLSKSNKIDIVQKIGDILSQDYIYPEKASHVETELTRFQDELRYSQVIDASKFAALLTQDLYSLTDDLHFHVAVNPALVAQIRDSQDPSKRQQRQSQERLAAKSNNFDFKQVSMLEGKVGYFKFNSFGNPDFADEKLASVMHFLADSEALIIDLRDNNGGYLEMAQMINSYFFENDDKTVLFEYYYNKDGMRVEKKQWVLPAVAGERMLETPLYILTSNGSFSSAEWMSYSLKHLGRATIVGEVSAGGAHPVENKVINDSFVINVPIGQIKSPAANGDFEGKGVQPDIVVRSSEALHTAHITALEEIARLRDDIQDLEWYRPLLESRLKPIQLSDAQLTMYAGDYASKKILIDAGRLYYSWNGKSKFELTPLTETLFSVAGIDDFRMQMMIDDDVVIGYKRVFKDGKSIEYLAER